MVTGDITVSGAATHEISADIELGDTGDWAVNDTTLFRVSGGISGAFWLKKTGSGTLMLTGDNTYTGLTWISGGTLIATGTDERIP